MKIQSQAMIAVKDVQASARWYARLLGLDRGHGGEFYEQLLSEGQLILQLHDMATEDEHGTFREDDFPVGNGVLLWFEVTDFDEVVSAATNLEAKVDLGPHLNPLAKHMEIRLRDLDGYRIVVAGPSEYSRQPLKD